MVYTFTEHGGNLTKSRKEFTGLTLQLHSFRLNKFELKSRNLLNLKLET